jgi:hypothetical protein
MLWSSRCPWSKQASASYGQAGIPGVGFTNIYTSLQFPNSFFRLGLEGVQSVNDYHTTSGTVSGDEVTSYSVHEPSGLRPEVGFLPGLGQLTASKESGMLVRSVNNCPECVLGKKIGPANICSGSWSSLNRRLIRRASNSPPWLLPYRDKCCDKVPFCSTITL